MSKTIIKLIYLNNKSRQGWYIYKRSKGKSHYYKKQEGYTEKDILKFYNRKKNQHRTLKPKTKTATLYGTIDKEIKPGIKEVEIPRPHEITRQEITKAKEILLKDSIKNKKAREMIIQPHNLDKIKHRFEYTITCKDERGNVIATASKANETIEEAIKAAQSMTLGESTDMTNTSPSIKRLRENHGWTAMTHAEGNIMSVTLKIIFRKAK